MQVQIKQERTDNQYPVPGQDGSLATQGYIPSSAQSRQVPPLIAASHVAAMTNQHAQYLSQDQMPPQNAAIIPEKNDEAFKAKITENQIDYSSFKGKFGWTTIDGVNVPYIFRKDKKFVSVRIVEQKLLSRYPNSYPDELGKHQPLTSFFVTETEAKLLNEINIVHCGVEFGTKQFNIKDLIVLLEDFHDFYNLVKKTFPENMMNEPPQHKINKALSEGKVSPSQQGCGWIQVNNTITPFVKRINDKYVPLSVMKYAASLNVTDKGELPEAEECDMLNRACQEAGFNFSFSKSTRIVSLTEIMKNCQVHVIDLPSENPLQYAQYLEFQQSPGADYQNQYNSQQSVPPSQSLPENKQFPPNVPNQNRHPAPRPGMHPAFVDPRFMFSYNRFPFQMYNYGPPNVTVHPSMSGGYGQMGVPPSQYTQNGQILNGQPGNTRIPGPANIQQFGNNPNRTSSAGSTGPPSQRSPGSTNAIWGEQGVTPQMSPKGAQSSPSPNSREYSQFNGYQQGPSPQYFPPPPASGFPARHGVPGQIPVPQNKAAAQQPRQSMPPPYPYGQNGHSYYPPPQNRSRMSLPNTQQPVRNHTPQRGNPPPPLMSGPYPAKQTKPPPDPRSNNRQPAPLQNTGINNQENKRQSSIPNHTVNPSLPKTSVSNNNNSQSHGVSHNGSDKLSEVENKSSSLADSIKGVWLGGKSISCMHMDRPHRSGKFCLVEAVCKLYFNGCSVNEFLFALENVLKVPLMTCTDEEEKAFINYYSLPVTVLKCNKMIDFNDLDKYFPQLSYVFRGKTGSSEPPKQQNQNSDSKEDSSSENRPPEQTTYVTIPLSTVSETQNSSQKRKAVASPTGTPPKVPCRRLEETVQRLLNQQGPVGTGEPERHSGTGSVIVLD